MKYNLSKIMLKAWKIYRKTKGISFGESLHRAWLSAKAEEINAKRIETAKQAVRNHRGNQYLLLSGKSLVIRYSMEHQHYSDVL